jgi:hypothetical protein
VKLSSLLIFLVGCTCTEVSQRSAQRCVRSHEETTVEYGIGGVPLGGQQFGTFGPQVSSETKCDQYEMYMQQYCSNRRWFWQ